MSGHDVTPVATRLTSEDLYRFLRFHHLHVRRRRTWLAYLGAMAFGMVFSTLQDSLIAGLACAAVIGIGLPLSFRPLLRWQVWINMRQFPNMLLESTVSLSPEGVSGTGSWGDATLHWRVYRRIVGSPDAILFYRTADFAEIIPRRAFPTSEAADRFLKAAQTWHAEATMAERG